MVLTFEFRDNDTGKHFTCPMQCKRCTAHNKNGRQCNRTVCIGLPYCWLHLQQKEDIKIKNGRHGKGVFAWDKSNSNKRGAVINTRKTIFKPGQVITKYNGEKTNERITNERYGNDATAPYAIALPGGTYEDGACKRGSGTIFNHSNRKSEQKAKLTYERKKVGDRWVYNGVVKCLKPIKNGQEIFVDYGNRYRFGENTTQTTKNKHARRRGRR